MLCILFFLFINFSFSEKVSINPEKKPPQTKVLMSRLRFSIKNGIDIKTRKTVSVYLQTSMENKKKIDFIISLLNQKSKKGKAIDIKRKIFSSSIDSCKKSQCLLLLQSLPKIKTANLFNKSLRKKSLELLKVKNYSPEIIKGPFLKQFLNQSIQDDRKNLEKILSFTISFPSFFQYSEQKLAENKKNFGNEKWFQKIQCYLSGLKGDYEKAKKLCLPHKFSFYFNEFTNGKKITKPNIDEIENFFGGDKNNFWLILAKIMFLKNTVKVDLSKLDMDKTVTRYKDGYYLIKISKFYRLMDEKTLNELTKKYSENFEGSFFVKDLNSSTKPEELAQIFGKHSIIYQLSILK